MLITCRENEFNELVNAGVKFPLNGAVKLEELSTQQREEMLSKYSSLEAIVRKDKAIDRLTRNPLMLALFISSFGESGYPIGMQEPQVDESLRDLFVSEFLSKRLKHEEGKYQQGLDFDLKDIYKHWGYLAMRDAGGGGNKNVFLEKDIRYRLQLSSDELNAFLYLSLNLGLIYTSTSEAVSFAHMIFRDHFAFKFAEKALFDPNPDLRDSAGWSLWQIPDKRAVPILIKALKDPYKYARGSAAGALGMIKDRRAIEPLSQLLADHTEVFSIYGGTISAVAQWAINEIESKNV